MSRYTKIGMDGEIEIVEGDSVSGRYRTIAMPSSERTNYLSRFGIKGKAKNVIKEIEGVINESKQLADTAEARVSRWGRKKEFTYLGEQARSASNALEKELKRLISQLEGLF